MTWGEGAVSRDAGSVRAVEQSARMRACEDSRPVHLEFVPIRGEGVRHFFVHFPLIGAAAANAGPRRALSCGDTIRICLSMLSPLAKHCGRWRSIANSVYCCLDEGGRDAVTHADSCAIDVRSVAPSGFHAARVERPWSFCQWGTKRPASLSPSRHSTLRRHKRARSYPA